MAFVQIGRYGITWAESDRRFVLGLFRTPGSNPRPDFEIKGLSAEEVSAFIQIFQVDKDRKIFYDAQARTFTSGIEPV